MAVTYDPIADHAAVAVLGPHLSLFCSCSCLVPLKSRPVRRPMPGGARQQAERVRPAPRLRGALIQKRTTRQYEPSPRRCDVTGSRWARSGAVSNELHKDPDVLEMRPWPAVTEDVVEKNRHPTSTNGGTVIRRINHDHSTGADSLNRVT
jgi:hypothetical protein